MLTITLKIDDQIAELVPRRLRDSCPRADRYLVVEKELTEPSTPYDILGSLGIPPCEIGQVFSVEHGRDIQPDALVKPGPGLVIEGAAPRALIEARFLCDGHLGKLAMMLRILGFDSAWDNNWSEPGLARRGVNEGRVVLSRSRSLLKRRTMTRAQLIRSDQPDQQAVEVLRRFMLAGSVRLFGRCRRCNGTLATVPKAEVADRIPPRTALWLDDYYICRDCDHLFWEGTHVTALRRRLDAIVRTATESRP